MAPHQLTCPGDLLSSLPTAHMLWRWFVVAQNFMVRDGPQSTSLSLPDIPEGWVHPCFPGEGAQGCSERLWGRNQAHPGAGRRCHLHDRCLPPGGGGQATGPCLLGSAVSLLGLPGQNQVRGHPSQDTVASAHHPGRLGILLSVARAGGSRSFCRSPRDWGDDSCCSRIGLGANPMGPPSL